MPARIEVFRGKGLIRRWYFHVRAGNNRITFPSQGYTRKASAIKAATKAFPDLPIKEVS